MSQALLTGLLQNFRSTVNDTISDLLKVAIVELFSS